MATLCFLLLVISGCGSSGNKEGDTAATSTVSAAACVTCHSQSVETLTGYAIVTNYRNSVHNLNSTGCQDCHGAGGQHNGVGPIPYPRPNNQQCQGCHDTDKLVTNYASSKHLGAATEDGEKRCNRCHTHKGAVLSAIYGFTGDKISFNYYGAAIETGTILLLNTATNKTAVIEVKPSGYVNYSL